MSLFPWQTSLSTAYGIFGWARFGASAWNVRTSSPGKMCLISWFQQAVQATASIKCFHSGSLCLVHLWSNNGTLFGQVTWTVYKQKWSSIQTADALRLGLNSSLNAQGISCFVAKDWHPVAKIFKHAEVLTLTTSQRDEVTRRCNCLSSRDSKAEEACSCNTRSTIWRRLAFYTIYHLLRMQQCQQYIGRYLVEKVNGICKPSTVYTLTKQGICFDASCTIPAKGWWRMCD